MSVKYHIIDSAGYNPTEDVDVIVSKNEYGKSNITVIGDMLPRVWEESVIATYEYGEDTRTMYDTLDAPTKNTCMTMVINHPWAEPSIHKAIPCGLEELETYRLEVCEGLHYDWIDHDDPQKWQYNYYERIFAYPTVDDNTTDQFYAASNKLINNMETRRANISIWDAKTDNDYEHPPCLQIIDFSITRTTYEPTQFFLNTTVYMRSNCAMKAAAMNMFAFNSLAEKMADTIAAANPEWAHGESISIGTYTHIANSYHIYGDYIAKGEYDAFKKLYDSREFADRAYYSYDATVKEIFKEAQDKHYAK